MEDNRFARFFLGANAPGGFASLYDSFTDPETDHLYILKGGPGCGKSTFMKKLAAAAGERGHAVECIHCSGDPDSLDGVRIPDLHIAYVDGTSPHVVEPRFAGSEASYVNFGAFYDLDALAREREGIAALTSAYKARCQRAFRLLSGASALSGGIRLSEDTLLTAARRARGLIRREIRGHGKGRSFKRFLSAYTCQGPLALWDTVPALAERIYLLDNELGLADMAVEAAASEAQGRGYGVIRCQSPLDPARTEHVIVPELSLAILSQTPALRYPGKPTRHLRLDAIPSREELAAVRPALRRTAKLRRDLLNEAVTALREAKSLHDGLEALYIPHVDFAGIDRLTERHIAAL